MEQKERKVLVIDCGTQSLRTMIFNQDGLLLAKIKEDFEPYYSSEPGYAEKDPGEYWEAFCSSIRRMHQEFPSDLSEVEAITVTTMRDTGVYLDEYFQVVRPSIIWLDEREAQSRKISPKFRAMFKLVGMEKTIQMTRKQCKAHWIRENEPENWKRIKYYLLLSGYFHYKLTGKIVDSIGNQIGHIPFNYKKMRWPKTSLAYQWEVFRIERELLPPLVETGSFIGELEESVREALTLHKGIRIIAGASDKGCETLGVGCLTSESAAISFGTAASIQTTTDRYVEPLKFMPSYPAVISKRFNPEIQIYRGYWMIRWFKEEFAHQELLEAKRRGMHPEELLNQLLHQIPPGSEGLMLQPYWKPSLKNPDARGAIIGFSDTHNRVHIYRAIIEGINFALRDGLDKIVRSTGVRVKTIYVSGGGSQSDEICQITADMFDCKVIKGENYEAGGLGAAICAFVALKVYSTYEEAAKCMIRRGKVFRPNPVNAEIYHKLYNRVYKRIYANLKKLYIEIESIVKKDNP